MINDTEDTTSVPQDEWASIAGAVREHIRFCIHEGVLRTMGTTELRNFLELIRIALFTEVYATSFDAQVKEQKNEL